MLPQLPYVQLQQLFVKVVKFGYIIMYHNSTYSEVDVMSLIWVGLSWGDHGRHDLYCQWTGTAQGFAGFLGVMLAVFNSRSRTVHL